MKRSRILYGKKLLPLLILLLLVLSLLNALSLNIVEVSAGDYPAIYVEPATIENATLTPGTNFTVSIKTNYTEDDVWGYEFTLTYNPLVLEGARVPKTDTWTGDNVTILFFTTNKIIVTGSEEVYVNETLMTRGPDYTIDYQIGKITFTTAPGEVEVKITYLYYGITNGDLITGPLAVFMSDGFNDTLGKLGRTNSGFFSTSLLTSGPGTLANVTFTVVGTGASNITLGPDTQLIGRAPPYYYPYIIPTNTRHSYFINVQPIHDVAVVRLVAPATVILGQLQLVPINVTVGNEGNYTESVSVTVYNDTTKIGTEFFTLDSGLFKTVSFIWNISGVDAGNYTLTANATILESAENPDGIDDDPADNTKTKPFEIKKIHDIAILAIAPYGIFAYPAKEILGDIVSINVTVANEGNYDENVTLTVSYKTAPPSLYSGVIDTANFTLNIGLSQTVSFNWNTTDLATRYKYIINATATIALDEYPSNNINITYIKLKLPHDVAVTSLSAPSTVFVGDLVTINVTVENVGWFTGTFNVTAYYSIPPSPPIPIETQNVTDLDPSANTTLLFSWDTTDVAPAAYLINASAILDGDANTENNEQTKWVTVKLPPGNIAGTVTDASTGDPIEGANVTANGYSDITDANGHYNITVDAGTYNVTASANGYQTSSQTNITVDAGETTSVDFELTLLPGNIAGTVTDASTGDPIAGATVTADGNSATTDANGAYTINNVSPGDYTVTASAAKYVEQSKTVTVTAGTTTTLNFELIPMNGTISGIVTDSSTGDPISGATVTADGMSAITNSSGHYTISDVPAGTYTVTVSADGYKSSSQTDITVVAEATTTVNFELTPALSINILLYAGVAAVAIIIIIAGIAVYILKVRKPT